MFCTRIFVYFHFKNKEKEGRMRNVFFIIAYLVIAHS